MSRLYPFEREYLNALLEKRMRKNLRRLPKRLRKFALTLKRVMLKVPGPESDIRKKVISALKIGRATYFERLRNLELELEIGAMGEGQVKKEHHHEYENH